MNITIVGGGTIGWLSAFILSKKAPYHNITVIDSSKHPIIGVGEALTGLVTDLFLDKDFNLNEFEFLKDTWSLPKYGINFRNWQGNNEDIWSAIEGSTTCIENFDRMFYYCLKENINLLYSSKSGLAVKNNNVPFYIKDNNLIFPNDRSYSYHIDAYKFSEFFKKKSTTVKVLDKSIIDVKTENNQITQLKFDDGDTHEADFFIDATGFSKVLMSKLNNNIIDYSLSLPVNNALIFKPKSKIGERKQYSNAIARDFGWQFEIPTRNKIGRGYIYNSDFVTKDKIIKELENEYGKIDEVKQIKFKTYQLENSWVGNCLCLGLSASFLEPLQASSLHIAITSLEYFYMNCLGQNKQEILKDVTRKDYNNFVFNFNLDAIDFVQATYLTGRKDTIFWRYMNEHSQKSEKLSHLIDLVKHRLSRSTDFNNYINHVGQSNWNYTFEIMNIIDKNKINRLFNTLRINDDDVHDMYIKEKTQYNLDSINNNYMTVEQLNDYLKDVENG